MNKNKDRIFGNCQKGKRLLYLKTEMKNGDFIIIKDDNNKIIEYRFKLKFIDRLWLVMTGIVSINISSIEREMESGGHDSELR